MPRGKGDSRQNGNQQPEWGGYIDVSLSDADKVHFAEWREIHALADLDDVLGEGIKAGVSLDATNQSYLATLTSDHHAGKNLRCVLTARAGLWETALALVLFKHLEMLNRDWAAFLLKARRGSEVD